MLSVDTMTLEKRYHGNLSRVEAVDARSKLYKKAFGGCYSDASNSKYIHAVTLLRVQAVLSQLSLILSKFANWPLMYNNVCNTLMCQRKLKNSYFQSVLKALTAPKTTPAADM